MADRRVTWEAVADFSKARREARKTEADYDRLREAETRLNESSATSSARADEAQRRRGRTLRDVSQRMAEYATVLRESAQLEARAGGSKQALIQAERRQLEARRRSEAAAQRLAAAEQRLAVVQERSARQVTEAETQQARARNQSERAAVRLQQAESRLNQVRSVATSSMQQIQRAELQVSDARLTASQSADRLQHAEQKLAQARSFAQKDSVKLVRAEQQVRDAWNDSARAAETLEEATESLGNILRTVSGAGAGLGKVLGSLVGSLGGFAGGIQGAVTSLAAFGFKATAVIVVINALVTALGALAGGAFALASALAPAVGVLGSLPQVVSVAAGAIGVLALAFFGVQDAVKASLDVQRESAKTAKDNAKAQQDAARRIRDAQRSVRDAVEARAEGEVNAARRIADAQRSLRDARESAVEAALAASRALDNAERGLISAQERARQAQLDLNRAREDAAIRLREMKEAADDSFVSEEQGAIRVERARERLQQVLSDPGSSALDKREAELAVQEAEAALRDTKQQSEEARKEYEKAQKKGVEKSDEVVAAKKAEKEALEDVRDAQLAVAEAVRRSSKVQRDNIELVAQAQRELSEAIRDSSRQQRDSAEAVARAQENLKDAYDVQTEAAGRSTAAQDKLQEAMGKLSPEGRKLVAVLLSLKDNFDLIRFAAQRGLFPGVISGLLRLSQLTPLVADAMERIGGALGDAFDEISKVLTTPLFQSQFKTITASNVKILESMGRGLARLIRVIAAIMVAAAPLTEWLFETAEGWVEQWDAMTSGEKGQKRMKAFFKEVRETLQVVGRLFAAVVKQIVAFGKASKGSGKNLLLSLVQAAEAFAAWASSTEGQNTIRQWFQDMVPVVKEVAKLIRDIFFAIFTIARDPNAARFFKDFRENLLPAMVRLMQAIGLGGGTGIVNTLAGIVDFVARMVELGAFGGLGDTVAALGDLSGVLSDISDQQGSGEVLKFFIDVINGMPLDQVLRPTIDALVKLKDLLTWFLTPQEGDQSQAPIQRVIAPFKELKVVAEDVLAWLRMNWPSIVQVISGPVVALIALLKFLWNRFGSDIRGAVSRAKDWVRQNWPGITAFLTSPVSAALTALSSVLFPGIIQAFKSMFNSIVKEGGLFNSAFSRVWDQTKKIVADPIGYVVQTILNGGLIAGFNSLARHIAGNDTSLQIPNIPWPPPGFHKGGVYPGYTPGRDIGYIGISGGEAIMRPEWTRAIGEQNIDRMNALARRGGPGAVRRRMGFLGGFRQGGVPWGPYDVRNFRGEPLNVRTIRMILAAETLPGVPRLPITQGSYQAASSYSGTTHVGGGVFDTVMRPVTRTVIAALRKVGFAAWDRTGKGNWAPHAHSVALGDATLSPSAAEQARDYMRGGDGLGGRDNGPRVPIDPLLAKQLFGSISLLIRAIEADKDSPGILDRLAGWAKSAVGNPVGYLRGKLAGPLSGLFDKFGDSTLVKVLAQVPEMLMSAMADRISTMVGDLIGLGGESGGGGDVSGLRAMVQQKAAAYGWGTGPEWAALQWIINRESGWRPTAQNPSSTAFGLFQFLNGTWESVGGRKTSDPGLQTDYGLRYIRQRYGSPAQAQAFHQMHGWYSEGGVVPNAPVQAFSLGGNVRGFGNRDTVPAMLTPGEFVLRREVVRRLGKRKLEILNRQAGKPTGKMSGVQYLHRGGPVLGMQPGGKGLWATALKYLRGLRQTSPVWDGYMTVNMRNPNAAGALVGPPGPNNKQRLQFLDWLRASPTGRTWAQAQVRFNRSDSQMIGLVRSVWTYMSKFIPYQQRKNIMGTYVSKLGYFNRAIGDLNTRLGLRRFGQSWTPEGRVAMAHVFNHAFRRPHNDFASRPWQALSPAEQAAYAQVLINKKQAELNGWLETLSTWGLTYLVEDLLKKDLDAAHPIASSAVKNRYIATLLNEQLKLAQLLTSEDQANILRMITLLSTRDNIGLRDAARHLKLSDLATVRLFENGVKANRFSRVPAGKLSRLKKDVAAYRAGTFYGATGGQVPGSGSGDTVPAMLTPGEFVIRKEAARLLGIENLENLNNLQWLASGGLVKQFSLTGAPTVRSPGAIAAHRMAQGAGAAGSGVTNYYDIDIINPVAERPTYSLMKFLQRQALLRTPEKMEGR